MKKEEKIKEDIASRIYTDWNKSPEYTWETLPEYRKQSYRDWVDEYVIKVVNGIKPGLAIIWQGSGRLFAD